MCQRPALAAKTRQKPSRTMLILVMLHKQTRLRAVFISGILHASQIEHLHLKLRGKRPLFDFFQLKNTFQLLQSFVSCESVKTNMKKEACVVIDLFS